MARAVASKTNSRLVTELSLIRLSGEAYYFIGLVDGWRGKILKEKIENWKHFGVGRNCMQRIFKEELS